MKAIAKMYRVKPDGSRTPVEAFMSDAATAVMEHGEEVIVELWHGSCLEAEVRLTHGYGDPPMTMVVLRSKKELRSDAPKEALC